MSQKQVVPKSEGLGRSLEINAIWTFDTEFPTIFNKNICINVCIIKIHVPRAHEVKNQRNHARILLSSLQLNTDNWVTATLGDRLST